MLIRNSAANLAAQLLYPAAAFVLVPFYLDYLGVEGYGLVGLLSLAVSLLGVFSRGLGAGLQREISRRSNPAEAMTLRRLVGSVEVLYWTVGALLTTAIVLVTLGGGAAWLEAPGTDAGTIVTCLVLLAIRVGIAFPHGAYYAVFIGTERQVLGSALTGAQALASAAANVIAVITTGSVVAFYVSEIAVAAVFAVVLRRASLRILPTGPSGVAWRDVRLLLALSAALMWTSGIGLLLAQVDRLIVTVLLPVSALGVLTIAVMGGRLVTLIGSPLLQAAYPRTCRLARDGTPEERRQDLLRTAGLVAIAASAAGLPAAVFAPELLLVWLGDASLAERTAPIMVLYAAGTVCITLASALYQLQVAAGRTRPAVVFNSVALVWFPVASWWMVSRMDLAGAALAWLVYGALAWLFHLRVTFRQPLTPPGALWPYLRMTGLSLGSALVCLSAGRYAATVWFGGSVGSRLTCGAVAALCGGLSGSAACLPYLTGAAGRNPTPSPRTAPAPAGSLDDAW